jgi:hypothetical protein
MTNTLKRLVTLEKSIRYDRQQIAKHQQRLKREEKEYSKLRNELKN